MNRLHIAIVALVLSLSGAAPALAQDTQQAPKIIKLEPYLVEKFVKYTVIAVDQANQTGNYTVLHAMGTPAFKKASPADLFKNFEAMRKRGLDLSSILLYKPKLSTKPQVVNGMLRATGYFPTEPLKLNFDILYAVSGKRLLLHFLVINASKDVVQAKPAADAKVDKPAEAN